MATVSDSGGDDLKESGEVTSDVVPEAILDDTPVPETTETTEKSGKPIAWAVALVVAVLGAWLAGYVATGLRMPADATVGGVAVGGLSPDQARAAVAASIGPRVKDVVVLTHEDRRFPIAPESAGMAVDIDQSVRAAGGHRSLNPLNIARLVAGHVSVPLVVSANDAQLAAAIAPIAAAIDKPAIEPLITFDGVTPVVREPQAGSVVDQKAAARAVKAAYLTDGSVELPIRRSEPTVDRRGVERAMTQIVAPALSGPVIVKIGDQNVELPVTAYAPALSVRVVGKTLRPRLDVNLLAGPLTNATTGLATTAVDATVAIKHGRPVVVPAKPGVGLQPAEMAQKLLPAILAKGPARSVTVESKIQPATFTTDDAKALNIKEKISEFVTYFPYAHYRNYNQSRAAELINGTILKPGEIFSMNDRVGERSEENGFIKGIVIGDGGVFVENFGGGVSQVVTTLYNAAFFAGLDDIEHHPHTFYIPRYPLGREATVWYGNLDLRFRNNLANGVLIRAWVVKGSPTRRGEMHVQMWGTKEWNIESSVSEKYNLREPSVRYDPTDTCVEQQPSEGFDIDVTRTFRRVGSDVVDHTDQTHVSYIAGDKVLCEEPPVPAPTPTLAPAQAVPPAQPVQPVQPVQPTYRR